MIKRGGSNGTLPADKQFISPQNIRTMDSQPSEDDFVRMIKQNQIDHTNVINQLVGAIMKLKENISQTNHTDNYKKLLEKQMYFGICLLDIKIGLKYFVFQRVIGSAVEANYFARVLALNSYELMLSSATMAGGEMQRYRGKEETKDIVKLIDGFVKSMTKIKDEEERTKMLGGIRNNLICHRKGGLNQYELMDKVDADKIYGISENLFSIHLNILQELQNLNNKIRESGE